MSRSRKRHHAAKVSAAATAVFLAFVDEEVDGLAERWLARRDELEADLDVAR